MPSFLKQPSTYASISGLGAPRMPSDVQSRFPITLWALCADTLTSSEYSRVRAGSSVEQDLDKVFQRPTLCVHDVERAASMGSQEDLG